MAIVFRLPAAQVVDANGNPLSGAKLYFYERGTTTPKNVFSDEGLTTPISQPVVANSAGQWAQIYMSADRYRVQLYTAADALVADWDNHDPGQPVSATAGVLPLTLGGTGVTSLSALQSLLGIGAASTWTDVTSAGTVDLGAAPSSNVRITGTTTVTSFGTAASGTTRQLRFAAALTLTHNATSLILPTGANIATQADDTAVAVSLGSGNWIVVDYQRANGRTIRGGIDVQDFSTPGAATWTKPAGTAVSDMVLIMAWGAGGGGGANAAGGGGGGGGAHMWLWRRADTLGATESISVGSNGNGVAAPANGGNGGNTTFGAILIAYGGGGGTQGGGVPTGGGGGGWESAGATTTAGNGFGAGRAFSGGTSGAGTGAAIFGGAAGASLTVAASNSIFGGAGGGASSGNTAGGGCFALNALGGAGTGATGGGGGLASGGAGGTSLSGAGGPGFCRVITFRN